MIKQIEDAIVLHVHAVNLPIGVGQNALGQMMTDEPVDAENKHSFHCGKDSDVLKMNLKRALPGDFSRPSATDR
ncbi:hypothetical protein, partial [Candidatus Competibacter phosphatis]|uniref:hypothetical protein n=1 Tax=Candidatus Competibacter phosphatis TaxID=221280 RepID=UPI001FE58BF8